MSKKDKSILKMKGVLHMNKPRFLYIASITVIVIGLFFNLTSDALVGPTARTITKEIFEFLAKKGGKEFAENVGKKVGKEAIEELAEKTVKEIGEEGAKKLFRELSEQAIKHGDDVFVVAKKYGTSQTVKLLRELSEESAKKATKSLLNRGDELMPLVRKFGKEVLEIEAKHPGLSTRIVNEFGEEGLKAMKEIRTDQVIKILRREDILRSLTPEAKRELCRQITKPGKAEKITDIFERLKVVDALKQITIILGGTYIVSEKLLSSDVHKVLPDGSVVKDEISILSTTQRKYSPEGKVEEENITGIIGNLVNGIKGLFSEKGGLYFALLAGTGIGLFFVIRGLTPLLTKAKN